MIIEACLGMYLFFIKYYFSGKLKKGSFLAIFWWFLPPNFCKLSPHKFLVILLFKNIYMICTIRDHSIFLCL